jgi:signal transduction histidine kinase
MKSIRGSLLVYFFFVVVATLGAVSLLAYENTCAILQGWEATRADLLSRQYTVNCENERGKLDAALANNVKALASIATLRPRGVQSYLPVAGLLTNLIEPTGRTFSTALWLSRPESLLYRQLHMGGEEQISFDEEKLHHFIETASDHAGAQLREYFQINRRMSSWRSPSLGELSLPYRANHVQAMKMYDSIKGEFELRPGVRVRRLAIKTPIFSTVRVGGLGQGTSRLNNERPRIDGARGASSGQRLDRPRNQGPATFPTPSIFVQCAAETADRDAALARLQANLLHDLGNLRAESQATLDSLRAKIILINLATMAATVVGCIWLVQLGLVPLRRLTEAVSKVSPKDFRLSYEEKNLPRELRPIVDRLNGTLVELSRAFAREKQSAADISHELRTPLAALKTTIEVALRKGRSPEEYRETLEECRQSCGHMNELVERLLTLARLDAGVDQLRPSLVDVAALTEQCTAMVRPLAEAHGLQLQLERNGPVNLHTDPNKFREIVNNLLHNAIAYNRPHGKVAVGLHTRAGRLRLEVKDTGIGISEDAKTHIFDRFYRVDASRHAEGMHSGLGLSIVKGYVDLLGGSIDVASTLGSGSTFCIELPLTTNGSRGNPNTEAERIRSQS